ncbi:hypothetical protein M427DRAFT_58803 [Gonapodya prolifera JEL478]|uniref:Auxin efflux carrier n=1 Tax=Gonapodya prolifera (strain JEL478) TaxID=1344416 RepID=A0A139A992_GONPJ|nr:hypothetical protein M427DRAFT_58803 [Gonapodya prolifera JEL478]|eukprot:KXS13254.1 hypothetical protein M427DRAFT_58803 [Gonapodya prolifera JEL478]
MALSIGTVVWTALKPILRLLACLSLGFFLARSGKVTPSGCKQIAAVYITILVPSLAFTKTLPSINFSNIRYLLPVSIFVLIHMVVGLLVGWIVMRIFTIPKSRFRYTILAAVAFANTSDIPNAVSLAVGDAPPFSKGDSQLGVAYGSLYLLVFSIFLFTLGRRLVEMDWWDVPESDPLKEEEEERGKKTSSDSEKLAQALDVNSASPQTSTTALTPALGLGTSTDQHSSPHQTRISTNHRHPSRATLSARDPLDDTPTPLAEALSGARRNDDLAIRVLGEQSSQDASAGLNCDGGGDVPGPVWKAELYLFLSRFFSPGITSILLGVVLSLTPIRGWLLYPVGCSTTGLALVNGVECGAEPPLNWAFGIMDFWGGATLPMGLIYLGAALGQARLGTSTAPHGPQHSVLPQMALPTLPVPWKLVLTIVAARLLLLPAIGLPLVQLAGVVGAIPWEERILRFMMMLDSAVPTGNMIVAMTQVASPTGDASKIACVCLVQYALCGLTLTGWLVGALYLVS